MFIWENHDKLLEYGRIVCFCFSRLRYFVVARVFFSRKCEYMPGHEVFCLEYYLSLPNWVILPVCNWRKAVDFGICLEATQTNDISFRMRRCRDLMKFTAHQNAILWDHSTRLRGDGIHVCSWKWLLHKHGTIWRWAWFFLRSNLHPVSTMCHRESCGARERTLRFTYTTETIGYIHIQWNDYWMPGVPIIHCIQPGFCCCRISNCIC